MAKTIEIKGLAGAIEALALVSAEADFAQRSAVRAAGTRARSTTAKSLASKTSTVQKIWRKRVNHYPTRRSRRGLAVRKLWLGIKHAPKAREHRSVAAAIAGQPDAFQATMPSSGHRGIFRRKQKTRPYGPGARDNPRGRGALPISEVRLDVSNIGPPVLLAEAEKAMRGRYVEVLRSEFKRRVKRKIINNTARRTR